FVAFTSSSTNLVPGDTNVAWDVFVHDRLTGTTERVSVDSAGTQGNGASFEASISADGRFVAFASFATNLMPGDTNGASPVFVHAPLTATPQRQSLHSAGAQGDDFTLAPSIRAAGRFVAFTSSATNLVPGDTNGTSDVFVHDRTGVPALATLTLSPPAATNTVGTQHCVTATVKDASGNPTPGISVRFSVIGAQATFSTPSSGADTTDSAGQATFCFTASLPGDNLIHAFADTNNNGTEDAGEPSGNANKTWTPPGSTQFCEVTITDGGWIVANNGDRANFSGNAKVLANGAVQGHQQYTDQGPIQPMVVSSIELTATTCSEDRT